MLPRRIASKAPKHVASKLLKTAASASKTDSVILSKYAASLTAEHLERYIDKISIVGKDPYLLTMSQSVLPVTVSYESIIEYALHQKSAYTGAGFHCFKAVEAKQRFECGMVKLVEGIRLGVGDLYVVRGKVMHSMKMNEPNLTPWIVINGRNIICAHCDCVAGIGEVCSQVGAVLYCLTNIHHTSLSQRAAGISVTDVEQRWGRPSKTLKDNLQQSLQEIDFGHALQSTDAVYGNVPTLDIDSLRNIFEDLKQADVRCTAIQIFCTSDKKCYRCMQNSQENYVASSLLLQDLYDETLINESIERLRFKALIVYDQLRLVINKEAQKQIEAQTKRQWKSDLWKLFRIGRITASVLKRVLSTKTDNPSLSLLKTICAPDTTYFSTQATRYGKNMEKVALNKLSLFLTKSHSHASISEIGLVISHLHPEISAYPDGLLVCSCCEKAPIEIKCPFKFKDEKDVLVKLTQKRQPYLRQVESGYELITTHDYYAKVQAQIALTEADYGFFYVWTKQEDVLIRIPRDKDVWEQALIKTNTFFQAVVLPELMGKYYTRTQR